jgi:oligosaccharide repeat unit polymerase
MKRKFMNPAVLFSFLWFVILLLHFIFSFTLLNELLPLSISTYFIFFIGVLAFSFGSFIQTVYWQKEKIVKNNIEYIPNIYENQVSIILRFILLVIIVIGLPFFLEASYKIFIASNVENFFIGLRTELIYGEEDIGPLKYLFPFSFIVYAINLQSFLKERNQKNRILFITSFLVAITYAIFTTGRIIFLAVLVVYMGMNFIYNTNFSVKKLFLPIIIFMLIFISFGIVYGKGGSLEDSTKENIGPAAQTTAIYMVASLNALDFDMHHQFKVYYDGNNSLRFFIKIGKTLNLIPNSKVNDLLTPFVYVPYPTNVYTFYSPYIKDFGRFYSWLMIALFGLIHTFLYNKAISTKSLRYSLYYSIMLFPLMISFFADQYLSLTSFWLQMFFFIEGVIFLNKFFIKTNDRYNNCKLE